MIPSISTTMKRHKHYYVYVEQDEFYVPVEEDESLSEILDVYNTNALRDDDSATFKKSFLSRNMLRQNQILSHIIDKELVDDIEGFIQTEDMASKNPVRGQVKCNNSKPQVIIARDNRKENLKQFREASKKAATEKAKTAQKESSNSDTNNNNSSRNAASSTSSTANSPSTTTTTSATETTNNNSNSAATPPQQEQPLSAASSSRNNNHDPNC